MDVGRISGRLFINNVSLGLYAQMLGDPGYRQDKLHVAQTKLQAAFSDPELRRALRITPPDEAPLEGIIAVVVSTTPTSSHAGIGSANATAWTRGSCRSRCWTSACSRSSKGCSRVPRCSAPPPRCAPLHQWTSERLEMGVVGEMVRAGVDGELITFEAPLRFRLTPVHCTCSFRRGCPRTDRCHHWRPDCTPPEHCVAGCAQPWPCKKRVEAMILTIGCPWTSSILNDRVKQLEEKDQDSQDHGGRGGF